MNMQNFRLDNKNILITGASGGLGRGIALGLAEAGANLIMIARNKQNLDAFSQEIRNLGVKTWQYAYDLQDVEGISSLTDKIVTEVEVLDVLFNIAGINYRKPVIEFPLAEWRRVIDINLTAPFVLSQCFARHCIARDKPGKIVNITSLLSEAARQEIPAYAASKGGLKQITKALAVELAPHKINVNAIGPGYFRTELTEPLAQRPDFMNWVMESTPLNRWGFPEDLAGAAIYLSSSASDFVTGQTIYVDGGWLANL